MVIGDLRILASELKYYILYWRIFVKEKRYG
jgi:hypothetical protein